MEDIEMDRLIAWWFFIARHTTGFGHQDLLSFNLI